MGETGSDVGGGQANLSNAFADGFEFYDKLGQLSLVANELIFRQTLCDHEPYSLINYQGNNTGTVDEIDEFIPNPSYYTFLLFKRLVNNNDFGVSLSVSSTGSSVDGHDDVDNVKKLRLYAFCASAGQTDKNNGSVVLMIINLSDTITYNINFDDASIEASHRMEYMFESDSLESKHIYLNGKLLQLNETNGNVPDMNGKFQSNREILRARPLTYGFIVFLDTQFNACLIGGLIVGNVI